MRVIQWIRTLLIVVYVCIDSGYAQTRDNCGLERFQCYNGECIAGELLCDGRPDCRDSSDETEVECKKPEILCHSSAFRCDYGACVDGDSVCDGKRDCIDNSDETQPQCPKTTSNQTGRPTGRPTSRPANRCTTSQFMCDNGKCISGDYVCNGIQDCTDGSDETSAKCRSVYCPPSAFRCAYGACIDGDKRCNGAYDCVDGSDEDSQTCGGIGWPSPLPSARPTTKTTWPTPTARRPTRPSVTPGTKTCRAPPQPENGRWQLPRSQCSSGEECTVPEGTELGSGYLLIYSCNSGYKIIGRTDVSCTFEGKWLDIPVCTEIRCKALATASTIADCTYNNGWIPCESPVPPGTKADLRCKNNYLPETNLRSGQRKDVICNINGHWDPEPIRCVAVCGTLPPAIIPQIVGGVLPNITEFPWHATMYRDAPGEPKKFFCGASIIQENLLITAAHCVYDEVTSQPINASSIYILTGNLYRDYHYPNHNPILVKKNQVKHIYIVDTYLGLTGNYIWDIAILELDRPFVLSTYLVPVCIDILSDKSVLEEGFSHGKVAGFGRTRRGESSAVLQALTVPVIPLAQCKDSSQIPNTQKFITDDKFCAGYTNGSSVCDGDSGGGLVFETNGLWYLRGIVSVSLGLIQDGGTAHCDNNLYSLYTDISRHISWVQNVITKIERNQMSILCSNKSHSHTTCS